LAQALFAPLAPDAPVVPMDLAWPKQLSIADMMQEVPSGTFPSLSSDSLPALVPEEAASSDDLPQVRVDMSSLSLTQQQEKAQLGNQKERRQILEQGDPSVHVLVFLNQGITKEEVATYARYPHLAPAALRLIASTGEWRTDRQVVTSLLKNASLPQDVAQAILAPLKAETLQMIANTDKLPAAITAIARGLLQQAQQGK